MCWRPIHRASPQRCQSRQRDRGERAGTCVEASRAARRTEWSSARTGRPAPHLAPVSTAATGRAARPPSPWLALMHAVHCGGTSSPVLPVVCRAFSPTHTRLRFEWRRRARLWPPALRIDFVECRYAAAPAMVVAYQCTQFVAEVCLLQSCGPCVVAALPPTLPRSRFPSGEGNPCADTLPIPGARLLQSWRTACRCGAAADLCAISSHEWRRHVPAWAPLRQSTAVPSSPRRPQSLLFAGL